jgi:mono/diheme cytochrome c family protein
VRRRLFRFRFFHGRVLKKEVPLFCKFAAAGKCDKREANRAAFWHTDAMRLLTLLTVFALVGLPSPAAEPARKVDFARDVRPILADNCFQCHGPDAKARKADLRLDTKDGLAAGKMHILERVTSKAADEVMPPPKSGKSLTAAQIATLKAWLDQGGSWSSHWAFTAPAKPAIPKTKFPVANPIDRFIRSRLEAEGLEPAPPAEKTTQLRRVTLDLTGVPPTPEEVTAFLKDDSPQAWEKVVDRLLASPRYGERMAWRWLEAARYSDTNGYQTDAGRDMWRWRDWVIEAYNRNLPFDRFTIEQLAGDLLPHPTLDQRIATGFNRNHRGNAEGGIVPEEYAVEYVADRVETTATVWLGLTFTCCRCHDHKYDPFSQKEFYRLFAYFNNVPEKGRAVKFGNSPPVIKAPTKEQQKKWDQLRETGREVGRAWSQVQSSLESELAKWEATADPTKLPDWSPNRGLVARWKLDDARGLAIRENADKAGLFAQGRIGNAMTFDGRRFVESKPAGNFGFDDRFTLSAWINLKKWAGGAILSRMPEQEQGDGYSVRVVDGRVQVHLTKRWLDDALRVETIRPVELDTWTLVAVTYDGSRLAAGVKVYFDGEETKTNVLLDELNQSFDSPEPFRIGSGGGPATRFTGLIDDVRIYDRVLGEDEVRILAVADPISKLVGKKIKYRGEREKLEAYFIQFAAPDSIGVAFQKRLEFEDEHQRFKDSLPTVMVMEEMPTPRPAHVLIRGDYEKKGERVFPGVPEVLAPLPKEAPANRLGFAKWLVDPANPLTARVAVNRAWQLHFGTGLVKTTEDFGTQGALPTHPELLDWLALEFQKDWDLKRLHKLIVMSHTYRQSSAIRGTKTDEALLARFPRQRLSAEMVRDQALFASGLLVEKLGGPSVKPYQPPGLWKELSGAADYVPDTGEGLYRRSLYSYWKRTSPPPVLATFDAAGREICWVRESRTNTPLQALTLMNETGFVEASRKLAERAIRASGGRQPADADPLSTAFLLVLGRSPNEAELAILRRSFEARLAEYKAHPDLAAKLLAVGESRADPKLDAAELAAYAVVCGMILNLDEAVTKE